VIGSVFPQLILFMSVFEVSKGSFFRRDENADTRNNLLTKVQQLEELLARLDKQRQILSLECESVRSEKESVELFLARKSE
jgi:hypothetical protein